VKHASIECPYIERKQVAHMEGCLRQAVWCGVLPCFSFSLLGFHVEDGRREKSLSAHKSAEVAEDAR